MAPVKALIDGTINISTELILSMKTKMVIGANFCHVDKIRHEIQDIEVITAGNHIWHGTIPSLITSEIINMITNVFLLIDILIHRVDEASRKMLDPRA
jgi:hypothetical protein